MEENVKIFPGITSLNHDPYVMLGAAQRASLKGVIIIGEDADGELFFSSTYADGGDVLWWMELAKRALIDRAVQMQEE